MGWSQLAVTPLGLATAAAGAAPRTASAEAESFFGSQRQTFSFTSQQTGARITCGIQHSVSAQPSGENYLVVTGETDVVEGPKDCYDSQAHIEFFLDDGTGEDLFQSYSGTGGHVSFTNHFPDSWRFTGSIHRVYFNACSCSGPNVNLHPK